MRSCYQNYTLTFDDIFQHKRIGSNFEVSGSSVMKGEIMGKPDYQEIIIVLSDCIKF